LTPPSIDDPSLYVPPPKGTPGDPFGEGPVAAKARRQRSLFIALALAAFVALVFVNSVLKLAAHAHHG
jgi:hypothetical protein